MNQPISSQMKDLKNKKIASDYFKRLARIFGEIQAERPDMDFSPYIDSFVYNSKTKEIRPPRGSKATK